jgi:pseudaminic acid biosynthesis-associated methylase
MGLKQQQLWAGKFGENYANRNWSWLESDIVYRTSTGVSATRLLAETMPDIPSDSRILELGCNVGLKLDVLDSVGFTNLKGVDINKYACEEAQKRLPNATIINDSIENFVKSGEKFDLVLVCGVLIHIPPQELESLLKGILGLSKHYVMGLEYYSEQLEEINYRGESEALWKQDFPELFEKHGAKVMKKEIIDYKESDNQDVIYLIAKL